MTTIGSAWGFLACQGEENLLFGTSCSSATSSSSLFFMDWICSRRNSNQDQDPASKHGFIKSAIASFRGRHRVSNEKLWRAKHLLVDHEDTSECHEAEEGLPATPRRCVAPDAFPHQSVSLAALKYGKSVTLGAHLLMDSVARLLPGPLRSLPGRSAMLIDEDGLAPLSEPDPAFIGCHALFAWPRLL